MNVSPPGLAKRSLARLERLISRAFAGAHNPFHHLGALTIYLLWVVLLTGIYLFVFYRANIDSAWLSVERLTHDQWYAGGLMRSLHRYASDAAVITMTLHLLREFVRGRLRGPRWFSWVSGIPLIYLLILFGITGYWMVWDQLAQYAATSTARLMDWLPIFTDPMSRSFVTPEAVSGRLFTLIAFIHLVGLPIVMVLIIWFHLLRIRLPRINPTRRIMAGSLIGLIVLSFAVPVVSHAPADLDRVPEALALDWYYLAVFPLQDAGGEALVWSILAGGTLLLTALPWLPPVQSGRAAVVNLPDCTGCGFCVEDCPYGAIEMVPRSDQRGFQMQAQVRPSLCVACGICVGSCPSSSPFRRRRPLTTGIDLPDYRLDQFKQDVLPVAGRPAARLLIIGCEHGGWIEQPGQPERRVVRLPCLGLIPPAMLDYALRVAGYHGVVMAGCSEFDCYHRHGARWLGERIARARWPSLRERVPRERLSTIWLPPGSNRVLEDHIEKFEAGLADAVHERSRP